MTLEQVNLLNEARSSINAAKLLINGGFSGYGASRAYYAMFYIAEAFLGEIGLSFSKHSAVISSFGKNFAHTEKVPKKFHKFLIEGQAIRHTGDYNHNTSITPEQAREQISRAEEFLQLAENCIK